MTGCAVAYACAKAGLDTLVLEAERVGHGGTGRGAGFLSPEPGPSFRASAATHGVRDARRVFEAWRRGAIEGAALLRRLRINCQLTPRDSVLLAQGEDAKATEVHNLGLALAAGLPGRKLAPVLASLRFQTFKMASMMGGMEPPPAT